MNTIMADSGLKGLAGGRASSATALYELVRTGDDRLALVLRATLALVMFPHGAQKLVGWFGGPGYAATMNHLTTEYGLPVLIAFMVIVIEFFAPLALAMGLFSRVAAASIGAVMVGAALTTHLAHGFFMNWFGNQAGEGFEYHLLAVGLAVAVVVHGSGVWSLDRLLMRKASVGRTAGETGRGGA